MEERKGGNEVIPTVNRWKVIGEGYSENGDSWLYDIRGKAVFQACLHRHFIGKRGNIATHVYERLMNQVCKFDPCFFGKRVTFRNNYV